MSKRNGKNIGLRTIWDDILAALIALLIVIGAYKWLVSPSLEVLQSGQIEIVIAIFVILTAVGIWHVLFAWWKTMEILIIKWRVSSMKRKINESRENWLKIFRDFFEQKRDEEKIEAKECLERYTSAISYSIEQIKNLRGHLTTAQDNLKKIADSTLPGTETETIKVIKSEIEDHRYKISQLGKSIENYQRKLALAKSKLKELAELEIPEVEEEIKADFDKLWSLPMVMAVKVTEQVITVITDVIFVTHEKKRYKVGIGEIKIPVNSNKGCGIEIRNLLNTAVYGRHFPYSWNTNNYCFGSTLDLGISGLMKDKDYLSSVIAIIQCLQSAAGTAPERIKKWRRVS